MASHIQRFQEGLVGVSADRVPQKPSGTQRYMNSFMERVSEGKGVTGALYKQRRQTVNWVSFAVFVGLAAWLCSDRSFSAILTLAQGFELLSVTLLLIKMNIARSIQYLSMQSLYLNAIGYTFKLSSTLFYNGYLPVDRSGDWLIQLLDLGSLALTVYAISLFWFKHANSYNAEEDTVKAWYFYVPAFLIATQTKANLNHTWLPDVLWMFSLLIFTVAQVPQLWLLSNSKGDIEAITGHFIASRCAAQVFSLMFWLSSAAEVINGGSSAFSTSVILACHAIQVIMIADYLYYYVISITSGKAMIINDIDII